MLAELEADPARLVVEITEHAQIEDYEVLNQALLELRSAGLRVAVDDAGAGYSSLRHVIEIAPDMIKIDGSLTQRIEVERGRRALASALISFAQEMKQVVVAEGIETQSAVEALLGLGVHCGQGYFFGRPRPLPAGSGPGRGIGVAALDPAAVLGLTSDDLFRALTGHTGVGVFVSNVGGETVFVNDRWCELAGLTREEALGDGWLRALHPDDARQVAPNWDDAAAAGRDSVAEYRFVRPDGTCSWIQGFAAALRDEAGTLLGWIGTCVDLTERRRVEKALVLERERFRVAFDSAPTGMALLSPEGRWLEVNPALCDLLGYVTDELSGLSFDELTHQDDLVASREHSRRQLEGEVEEATVEMRFLRRDGVSTWVSVRSTLVRDAESAPLYFVAQIEDIGHRRRAQSRLRRLADTDGLTGLINRRRFGEEVDRELERLRGGDGQAALLLIDLDRFKAVNDEFGPRAGDVVLARVAAAITRRLRASDLVGRLGGDEFVVLIRGTDALGARRIADDLGQTLREQRINVGGRDVVQTASIGVVVLGPDTAGGVDDLLATGDRAMDDAKRAGRDRVTVAA